MADAGDRIIPSIGNVTDNVAENVPKNESAIKKYLS